MAATSFWRAHGAKVRLIGRFVDWLIQMEPVPVAAEVFDDADLPRLAVGSRLIR